VTVRVRRCHAPYCVERRTLVTRCVERRTRVCPLSPPTSTSRRPLCSAPAPKDKQRGGKKTGWGRGGGGGGGGREKTKEKEREKAARKVINKDGVDMRVPDAELEDSAKPTDFMPKPMGRGR
jgi:hypothetical protein